MDTLGGYALCSRALPEADDADGSQPRLRHDSRRPRELRSDSPALRSDSHVHLLKPRPPLLLMDSVAADRPLLTESHPWVVAVQDGEPWSATPQHGGPDGPLPPPQGYDEATRSGAHAPRASKASKVPRGYDEFADLPALVERAIERQQASSTPRQPNSVASRIAALGTHRVPPRAVDDPNTLDDAPRRVYDAPSTVYDAPSGDDSPSRPSRPYARFVPDLDFGDDIHFGDGDDS
ncbi:hypothetical protein M885DRAFT_619216 [Pelagophyceae sp. CCMP2097]|nr:hypothetical protein M885DRAFT_619216 [Pelagophyceae sp. CCMP2097]|mmetsp:Transcript_26240/g.90181  ORF Transcript_26240/g.90181 Transcript_26240/m.90181 type:complete len:235 (+) Transcript_26240:159-863(+)